MPVRTDWELCLPPSLKRSSGWWVTAFSSYIHSRSWYLSRWVIILWRFCDESTSHKLDCLNSCPLPNIYKEKFLVSLWWIQLQFLCNWHNILTFEDFHLFHVSYNHNLIAGSCGCTQHSLKRDLKNILRTVHSCFTSCTFDIRWLAIPSSYHLWWHRVDGENNIRFSSKIVIVSDIKVKVIVHKN